MRARGRYLASLLAGALLLCACVALAEASGRSASRPSEPACGPTAPTVAADAVGLVAERIYENELASKEVSEDRRQVEGNMPLLSALAAGDGAAVTKAVEALVYSGTHIVRLRVIGHGAVLADIGGPYIIAPVTGPLRLNGHTLGRYMLSVQDDLGYVKLETRFIGDPLLLLQDGHRIPLPGTVTPVSEPLPLAGPTSYDGSRYQTFSFSAKAFPEGTVRVSLLVPVPSGQSESCPAVQAGELVQIAETTWTRFTTIGASVSSYVLNLRGLLDVLGYVREGSVQLAGSTTPGPRVLPVRGHIRYRGVHYRVRSFAAAVARTPVRVYMLIPS